MNEMEVSWLRSEDELCRWDGEEIYICIHYRAVMHLASDKLHPKKYYTSHGPLPHKNKTAVH
jgi:hypothetical protein